MLKTVILVALLGLVSACVDYCAISPQNTMCLYKVNVTGSKCMQVFPVSITAADKASILAAHNDLRRRVAMGLETDGNPGPQPAASNMRELTWDDELAVMAQTWANQCNYAHDTNRNVVRFAVGQNLAIFFSTAPISTTNWNSSIQLWYDEVQNMDNSYVTSFPLAPSKGVIGHYTQAIWATTFKVGCGLMSYYDTVFQPTYPYKMYYVCNYGSTGNYINSPVYTVGPAATACPAGTVPKNGLCA